MATKEGQAVEVLCRGLSQVEPERDQRRNVRTSVNEQCVFMSLKTGSVKFLSFQMCLVSGLSEVDRDFMFCESLFLGIRKLQEG